jgi:hypothetical protein
VRLGTIFVRKNVLEDVTGDALTCVEVFDVILQGVMSQSDTGVSQINKMHFCQWRGSLGAQRTLQWLASVDREHVRR